MLWPSLETALRSAPGAQSAVSWLDSGESLSAAELLRRVRLRMTELEPLLKGPRPLVATLGDNAPDALLTHLALRATGVLVAELMPAWPLSLQARALDYLEPDLLLAHGRNVCAATNNPAWERVSGPPLRNAFRPRRASLSSAESTSASTLAFTGGSTGTLKAAELTDSGLLHVFTQMVERLRLTPLDRVASNLPWQHGYGRSVLFTSLFSGAALAQLPVTPFPAALHAQLAAAKPTVLASVPAQLRGLMRLGQALPSTLRAVLCAGAPFGGAEIAQLAKLLPPSTSVVSLYGLTEMCTRVSVSPLDSDPSKAGSCGILLQGIEARLGAPPVDMNGNGTLEVRGPNQMLRYWKRPEDSAEAFTPDGWLRTGDLGRIDAEGFLWVVGRSKQLVKRGAEVLYPEVLSAFLQSQGHDAAVLRRLTATFEDELCAVVETREEPVPSDAQLRNLIRTHLGSAYLPQRILFLPQLPRTAADKVDIAALNMLFEGAREP